MEETVLPKRTRSAGGKGNENLQQKLSFIEQKRLWDPLQTSVLHALLDHITNGKIVCYHVHA